MGIERGNRNAGPAKANTLQCGVGQRGRRNDLIHVDQRCDVLERHMRGDPSITHAVDDIKLTDASAVADLGHGERCFVLVPQACL